MVRPDPERNESMYNDDPRNPQHTWTHMPSYNPTGPRIIGGPAGRMADPPAAASADHGPNPYAVDIEAATLQNDTYRTALWTGSHLQLTVMSIAPGGEIGLEMHPHVDQFIRVEAGDGMVMMGDRADNLTFRQPVKSGWAFIIPAGNWHNMVNMGRVPVKLYSIYAPPNHPAGIVHRTQAEAEAEGN
jgi:mannose-6-phosphate isomerase-like protein (cupin superfamily)